MYCLTRLYVFPEPADAFKTVNELVLVIENKNKAPRLKE